MTEPKAASTEATSSWHTDKLTDLIDNFGSNQETGLTDEMVKNNLDHYGLNKLPESKPDTWWLIFLRQFKSPLIYLLMFAAVVVLALGEFIDGGIIVFVLLFNAIVGTVQAFKAQNTLEALKKFAQTPAVVRRNGQEMVVDGEEVVPGDIFILKEGQKVPADGRIIESHNLSIDEAALTGESEPVKKKAETEIPEDAPIGDRKNMVYKGTAVSGGHAVVLTVSTGVDTYIGYISKEIQKINTEIPLQRDIRHLSHLIIIVVVTLAVLIFSYGIWVGNETVEMFKLSVAVVVSAIPEALPIVMTLLLATGVWRMSKRNVLIKQLQAVEALGEAGVIAVDKTGTITKNELVVRQLLCHDQLFDVSGYGFDPEGSINQGEKTIIQPTEDRSLYRAGLVAALNSSAGVYWEAENEKWEITGDPTEAALTVLAAKIGLPAKDKLLEQNPRLDELPFESQTKYHAVLQQLGDSREIIVVGAPEVILKASRLYQQGQDKTELTPDKVEVIKNHLTAMSKEGLRVLAFASRTTDKNNLDSGDIDNLVFEGLFGMRDGLREGVAEAVATAKRAGIKTVMITGDYRVTAWAIAQKAGIATDGDGLMEGSELDHLTDQELSAKITDTTVFARVSPEHKLKIVQAYQGNGQIIAMTGDGVNDAMSLTAADLGMAMGRQGTEVAKEASDLIIMDDNFQSIIAAVEEGRSIYKGIKRVILFLFSTSIGEIVIITAALLLGWQLPVLAAQVIWINFVTDGFLVTALAMEPKEKGLLSGALKRPSRWIIDSTMLQRMLLMSGAMVVGTLWLFQLFEPSHSPENYEKAVTVAVTAIVVFQWFKAWNCRSDRFSIFQINPLANRYLIGAFMIVVALQLTATYTPFMQEILSLTPLNLTEWGLIISVCLSTILVDELWKLGQYLTKRKIKTV